MATAQGMRSLEYGAQTVLDTRRKFDVRDQVMLLDPNEAKLLVILNGLNRENCTDPAPKWFEDDFVTKSDTIAVAPVPGNTGTTFDPTTIALWRKYDLWMNTTRGDIVYVLNVNPAAGAGAKVTIARAMGAVAGTWTATDNLHFIGNAAETGGLARDMLTTQAVQKYNNVQTFKEAFEVDRTAYKTRLYGGNEMVRLRKKKAIEHNRDQERGLWFGRKDKVNATTHTGTPSGFISTQSWLMGGVFEFLSAGTAYVNTGSMTESEFHRLCAEIRYGAEVKNMFCAPYVRGVINSWGVEKLITIPSDTTYGIKVRRFLAGDIELNLMTNKLFYDMSDSSAVATGAYNYSRCSVILELEDLKLRVFEPTMLEVGIETPGKDSFKEQYLSDITLELHHVPHHKVIWDWEY